MSDVYGYFFRRPVTQIDINPQDAINHLAELGLSPMMQLVMDYFAYFLFVDKTRLGNNEFSDRHELIKEGILAIMNKKYDTGAQLISSSIEGIVRDSLIKDVCLEEKSQSWTAVGTFHKNSQPLNFFQLFEGALRDPRSRIGRIIRYLPEQEIDHIEAWDNKGIVLGEQGKHNKAIDAFDKAIEIDPKKASACDNRGESLRRQGNYVEAVKALNKAIELDPNHGDTWNNLCEALKSLGYNRGAAAAFAKAKELGYNA